MAYCFSSTFNICHLMRIDMQIELNQCFPSQRPLPQQITVLQTLSANSCSHHPESTTSWTPFIPSCVHSFMITHLHTAGLLGTTTLSIKQLCRDEKQPNSGHMMQDSCSIFHVHIISIHTHTHTVLRGRSIIGTPINKEQSDADLFCRKCKCE